MKKILLIILTIFITLSCWAENNPEERVKELASRIKQEKSMQPTLDYIHWETAFRDLGAAEKQMFSVNTPGELKQKMSSFLQDPSSFIKQQVKEQMGAQSIPAEQMQMFESIIEAQISEIKTKMDAEVNRIITADYIIHGSKITGNNAIVDVEFNSGKNSKREDLSLDLIDGQWWLSLNELQEKGTFSGSSKPE